MARRQMAGLADAGGGRLRVRGWPRGLGAGVRFAVVVLFACGAMAQPGGQLAWVAGAQQEDLRVHVHDLGTGETRPVGPGQRDGAPRWSPDGRWLAFQTLHGEGLGIYVVRHDGREGRVLAHERAWNHRPQWSPDARQVAYAASDAMDLAQVLVVHDLADGTETVWGGGREGLLRPVWVPNINLVRALDPHQELRHPGLDVARFLEEGRTGGAVITPGLEGEPGAMTTGLYLVTRTQAAPILPFVLPGEARYEEWAAVPDGDGQRYAFESNDGGDREIYLLNRRGIANISNHRAADWNPVWAPSGRFLAFESFRGGRRGVYRVYPETARVTPVAADPGHDNWAPAWSPDSRHVAFVSNRDGVAQIYTAPASGGDAVRITEAPIAHFAPAWRPAEG